MANDPWAEFPLVEENDPWAEFPLVEQREAPVTKAERARAVAMGVAHILPGADELRAKVLGGKRALLGGESYGAAEADELAKARAEMERVKRRTPGGFLTGQVAAGLATAPLIPGGPATTMLGRAGQGLVTGAGTGAIYGFGEGEGGFQNRVIEAGKQALTGGVTGAVLGPAVAAVGKAGRRAWDYLGGGLTPQTAAKNALARAVQEGGGDPAAAIQADLAAGAKDVTLGDVSKPARNLVRDVAAAPNRSQTPVNEFYDVRQAGRLVPGEGLEGGQFNRLTSRLRTATGVGDERGLLAVDDLIEKRKTEAGPLFEKALKFPAATDSDIAAAFQEVKKTSVGKEVMQEVKDLWSVEHPGVRYPKRAEYVPDMRVLKMMKEILDDKVDNLYGGTQPQTTMARAVDKLRDKFRDTLAKKNPDYGEALKIYSGKTALAKATKAGMEAGSGDPDKVALGIKTFKTEGEQAAYRLGVVTAIENQLGTASATGEMTDHTRKLLTINGMKRIGSLIPHKTTREGWDKLVDAEMRQSQTSAARGGSQTQPRAEVAKEQAVKFAPERRAGPWDMVKELGWRGAEVTNQALTRAKRGAMGEHLIRTDEDALKLLEELRTRMPALNPRGVPGGALAGQLAFDPINLLGDEQKRRLGLLGGQ